jgi:hypothetical protein
VEELRRDHRDGGVGNAALPGFGSLRGEDEGIEGLRAELGTRFGTRWCGGERARARQSLWQQWRLGFSASGASAKEKRRAEMERQQPRSPVQASQGATRGIRAWRVASTR